MRSIKIHYFGAPLLRPPRARSTSQNTDQRRFSVLHSACARHSCSESGPFNAFHAPRTVHKAALLWRYLFSYVIHLSLVDSQCKYLVRLIELQDYRLFFLRFLTAKRSAGRCCACVLYVHGKWSCVECIFFNSSC